MDADSRLFRTLDLGGAAMVRVAAGIFPTDLRIRRSDDGQYLLVCYGDETVAIYGPMGGNVELVEFADGECLSLEELLDLLAGVPT